MKQWVRSRRFPLLAYSLVLLIALAIELLFRQSYLASLEYPWSDLWFRLSGQTHSAKHLAIVELDEETLSLHPDDPVAFWTPHFAKAVAVLQAVDVKLIGLDFLFHASPETWLARYGAHDASRHYNQSFRQALSQGKVILAGAQPGKEALLPAPDYLLSLPEFDVIGHVGATDLQFDRDGTLRRLSALAPGTLNAGPNDTRLLSLPLLLAVRASGQSPSASSWQFGNRKIFPNALAWTLAFSGPPDSIPRLSMKELLAENALQNPKIQALRGRIVIVGARYASTNDVHMTPYGHGIFNARQMPGPEIQAQATEALLSARFIDPLSPPLRLLLLFLSLTAAAWGWTHLSIGRGSLLLGGGFVVTALTGWYLHRNNIEFPAAHFQTALTLLFLTLYGLRFSLGERERNRIRQIFSRYVSRNVVDRLIDTEHIPNLGGEAMPLTVLFSDIRNFTTLSEKLSPEEVVEILNTYFQRACAILLEEGGCIDKFIGDAVMVEFGAPLSRTDDAQRALRAALRLHQTAREFRLWMDQRFPGRDLPLFDVGVGLHTGTAVVGNIGSQERMEYTAIGDTVNLASRLEGATKQLGCAIIASRATVEATGCSAILGKSSTITVKGRNEPVEVFEILGLKEAHHA